MIPTLLQLLRRRLRNASASLRVIALMIAVTLYGTTGYLYYELPGKPDLEWADGLWYSIVTLTTVGYGDHYPTTSGGRFLVATPMMLIGIGLLGYLLSMAASALVEAKTKELHGMSELRVKNHLLIFNYSSLAKVERLLEELTADPAFGAGKEVVLIDEDLAELPPELARRSVLYVRGNPARDETLVRACADDAEQAIVLTKRPGDPHSDDLNVSVTLALKARAEGVHTVVECVDFATQELLRKAGCDGIVCTSRFDAHFLSHELMNPGVQEVMDELTSNLHGQQIFLTPCSGQSSLPWSQLSEQCERSQHIPLGVRRGDQTLLNLEATFMVKPGDRVVTVGETRLAGVELG